MDKSKKKYRVGLALGSGSSRGWSHIGVIKALQEHNITIDYIAGCSVGAFVGAIYCVDAMEALEEYVKKMEGKSVFSLFDISFSRGGLLNGNKVEEIFSSLSSRRTFEEITTPLKIVATDLNNGEKVILDRGVLTDAIRASMSIPGMFSPVKRGQHLLVDGGLVDPVPIDVARAMGAEIVIAVDLNTNLVKKTDIIIQTPDIKTPTKSTNEDESSFFDSIIKAYENKEKDVREKFNDWFSKSDNSPSFIDVVDSSIGIMQERITRINLAVDPPEILIRPQLGNLKILDYDKVTFTIEEGYKSMMEKMDKLKEML